MKSYVHFMYLLTTHSKASCKMEKWDYLQGILLIYFSMEFSRHAWWFWNLAFYRTWITIYSSAKFQCQVVLTEFTLHPVFFTRGISYFFSSYFAMSLWIFLFLGDVSRMNYVTSNLLLPQCVCALFKLDLRCRIIACNFILS